MCIGVYEASALKYASHVNIIGYVNPLFVLCWYAKIPYEYVYGHRGLLLSYTIEFLKATLEVVGSWVAVPDIVGLAVVLAVEELTCLPNSMGCLIVFKVNFRLYRAGLRQLIL